MTEPRTITIRTMDAGPVTVTCPPWCTSDGHRDGIGKADIVHTSADIEITLTIGDDSPTLLLVLAEHLPYGRRPAERVPFLSVGVDDQWWPTSPAGLRELADRMADVATQLRQAAEKFAPLVGGEDQ